MKASIEVYKKDVTNLTAKNAELEHEIAQMKDLIKSLKIKH